MFITISKKAIGFSLIIIFVISLVIVIPSISVSSPNNKMTIVIDAGHGGIDGGSKGINTEITEKELNLEYAFVLKDLFESSGINVVMTRTNDNGLYDIFSSNKKKDDMIKRKQIIEKSGAELVISIHMNSFPLKSCRGAQVFYKDGDENSFRLASSIQDCFVSSIEKARKNADKGDYYILNCSNITSVIVECGFLSNPEEESLLLTESHKQKICYAIFCGILNYFK